MATQKVTLQEIKDKMQSVEIGKTLFGATPKFVTEYDRRIKELGVVLCKEKKVSQEQFMELPMETQFCSKKVVSLFNSLNNWLVTQGA